MRSSIFMSLALLATSVFAAPAPLPGSDTVVPVCYETPSGRLQTTWTINDVDLVSVEGDCIENEAGELLKAVDAPAPAAPTATLSITAEIPAASTHVDDRAVEYCYEDAAGNLSTSKYDGGAPVSGGCYCDSNGVLVKADPQENEDK
ncbi:hypothetical protein EDC01DRAFT_330570 [Geopyxis carbonaria]|nr:hypothetical protein EDC01DRAFT_330570 [Geopyxis carbonaria]